MNIDPSHSRARPSDELIDVALGAYGVSAADIARCGIKEPLCISLLFDQTRPLYLEAATDRHAHDFYNAFIWLKEYESSDVRSTLRKSEPTQRRVSLFNPKSSDRGLGSISSKSKPAPAQVAPPEVIKLRSKKLPLPDLPQETSRKDGYAALLKQGQFFITYHKVTTNPLISFVLMLSIID
jgi:hypothetical protein